MILLSLALLLSSLLSLSSHSTFSLSNSNTHISGAERQSSDIPECSRLDEPDHSNQLIFKQPPRKAPKVKSSVGKFEEESNPGLAIISARFFPSASTLKQSKHSSVSRVSFNGRFFLWEKFSWNLQVFHEFKEKYFWDLISRKYLKIRREKSRIFLNNRKFAPMRNISMWFLFIFYINTDTRTSGT